MNFKEYVDQLNKFLELHPESASLNVISAKDDEGNGYSYVSYMPSIGHYDGEDFRDIACMRDDMDDLEATGEIDDISDEELTDITHPNSVCIN